MIGKWREQLDSKLRGQSEVLGVALLTAVVVILFATVALFLFTDFASEANDEQLLATVESDVTSENITIEHQGGDSFDPENVTVELRGDTTYETTLSDFSNPAEDNSSFAPGDAWSDEGLTLAGEFRLLVIDQQSNTILHDQTHEVKIEDVRLQMKDGDGDWTTNDVTMLGADPGDVTDLSTIQRDYRVQVRYNTGEGWKTQTGGTSSLDFDPPSGPLSVASTDEDGGVLQGGEPNGDQQDVDVSLTTNTSNVAVDEEIPSNEITVTVVDANIETATEITGIVAEPGTGPNDNQVRVEWKTNSTNSNVPPSVDINFQLEDQDGTIPISSYDTSTASNVDNCGAASGDNVTCTVNFDSSDQTLTTSDGELPVLRSNVDTDTEEVTATAVPKQSVMGSGDSFTEDKFEASIFNVTTLGASFVPPDEEVTTNIEVTNNGTWTDEHTITAEATAENGGELKTSTLIDSTEVLAPGQTFTRNPVYDNIPGGTNSVVIEVDTTEDSDSVTVDSMDPAEFIFETLPSVQVVREGGQDKIEVSYELKNVGDLTNTQQISLLNNKSASNPVETTSTTLGPGEIKSGSMTTASFSGPGWYRFSVATGNTTEGDDIFIDPADYEVTIDDARHEYSGGEDRVVVDYTVENLGDLSDTRNLNTVFTFKNGAGTELDQKSITDTVTFTGGTSESRTDSAVIEDYQTSEIEIDIFANETSGTVDDSASDTVNVAPGNLDLTITRAESNPNGNGQMVVEYWLNNTGDLSRSSYVQLAKLDNSGNVDRVMANTSDASNPDDLITLTGGQSLSSSISGPLKNGDVDGGVVNIRVNATDDAQASSQEERAVPTTPATVEFTNVNWVEDGEDLKVDSYTVENTGDTPAQSQQVTYTASENNVNILSGLGAAEFGTSDLLGDIGSALDGFEESDNVGALDPGETASGQFTGSEALTITDVLSGLLSDLGLVEIEAALDTNDDTDTYLWSVNPPTYEPSITDASFDVGAQEITADWEVENTGNFADGQKDIRFIVNGDQKNVISREIQPGSPETGTLTESVSGPSPLDGDVINVTVTTEDGTATDLINVNPNYFKINNVDFNFQPAAPGSDAQAQVVTYEVENTGDFPGTQDIEFLVNGNNKDSDTATLAPGDTTSGSFSTVVDQSVLDAANEFTITLSTDNDSQTQTLSPDPANFAINNVDATFENEQAKITSWTVENTGDFTDTQNIEFLINGNQRDSVTRKLAPGETTSGSFSDGVTESVLDASNEFTVSVRTDNETTTKTLSAQPASFDITSVNFAFEAATSSNPAQARVTSYTVENTGDFTDTQNIEFLIDNNQRDSVSRTLGPGDTDSGSFSTSISETSQFTAKLQTQDDSESQTFTPDPSYLAITSHTLNFNSGQATGSYTVENTGDFVADRNIDFDVDGSRATFDTVSVAPGDTASGSFSATASDPGQNNYDLVVAIDSQDERKSQTFTVDTAYFEVTSVSASYNPSTQSADTTYTIENTGDFQNSKTITTTALDDNNQATESVTLDPGQSVTNSKSVGIDSAGGQTIQVSTPDDSGTDGIFVSGPDFQVNSVSASYDASSQQANVDFTVKNEGDLEGTQDVTITTDPGGAGGSTTFSGVTRGPGGTFSQSGVSIGISGTGTIDLVVSTDDDSARDSITVNGPNLVITDYSGPSSVEVGGSSGSFTATYTVENQGDQSGSDYVDKYSEGSYDSEYNFHSLDPGESATGTFSYTAFRSDAPSITVSAQLFDGSSSASETVTVNADPEFQSTDVSDDGSNVECSFFGLWGACAGNWDHNLDYDVSHSLDDPSGTADKVNVEVDVKDSDANDPSLTDYTFGADDSRTWSLTDSWSDAVAGRQCNIDVNADFDVLRNGAITDQSSASTTLSSLC